MVQHTWAVRERRNELVQEPVEQGGQVSLYEGARRAATNQCRQVVRQWERARSRALAKPEPYQSRGPEENAKLVLQVEPVVVPLQVEEPVLVEEAVVQAQAQAAVAGR